VDKWQRQECGGMAVAGNAATHMDRVVCVCSVLWSVSAEQERKRR